MNVDYLRVSVTDGCNLRCIYCNPHGGGRKTRDEILTCEEIQHAVELFAQCGVRTVRLTGGEPLVRKDIVDLVRLLAAVPGIDDLALTTNGVLLGPMATNLKSAGLKRVNVSLDAVDPERFRRMTGSDSLPQVLAEMSMRLPVSVRFIEYCPTDHRISLSDGYVPNSEVRRIIESRYGPLSDVTVSDPGGPAVYVRIAGAPGFVGFIRGRSYVLCDRCNRLRLTSDGRIKPCLYSTRSYEVKRLLRHGLKIEPGAFAENITTEGIDLRSLKVGVRLKLGAGVELEITQLGKTCHGRCAVYDRLGDCLMPKEGVFARVRGGGRIKAGDGIEVTDDQSGDSDSQR